jgi:predicted peroxiredoxin
MANKLVLICTHAAEDPERATIPFVLATTAQAMDVEVIMGFQADGVRLASKGVIEGIAAPGFPPLKDLFAAYREAGGELLVCGPCVQSRKIDPKNDFVEGAAVVNAATFVKEFIEATNVLVY